MKKRLLIFALSAFILAGCTPTEQPDQQNSDPPEDVIRHEIGETSDSYNSMPKTYAESIFDFDGDYRYDSIKLQTSATVENGELLNNAKHHWWLTVETAEGIYLLYDEHIQLDNAEIDIGELHNEFPEKLIILTLTMGTGKRIIHYTFRDGAFYEELVYDTNHYSENGVNIIKSL